MKTALLIFTLFFSIATFAQSSKGSLINSLKRQFALTEYDRPIEFIRFNKDTILIAGYLRDVSKSTLSYTQQRNVIYKTVNGGKNWKMVRFKGNAWIYDTHHNQDGKIWLGGSDHVIHYSNDFGETWHRKIRPFNPTNRVSFIFMADSLYGIAGGLSNGLAITHDNWKSSIQIDSPLDQGKFQILKKSARNRVDQIAILDSLILINQNDYIFYSKANNINWQKFNIPVSDFWINTSKKEISLVSKHRKIFVIGSDLRLKRTYYDHIFPWGTIKEDTTKIDLTSFLETSIKSIKILSAKYEFDKQVHMVAFKRENIQKAQLSSRSNMFRFRSKGYKKRIIKLTQDDIVAILSNNLHLQLSELSNHLKFTNSDFKDYELALEQGKKERLKREKWGGNPTSQINLSNPFFKEPFAVTSNVDKNYLVGIYNRNYFPFTLENEQKNYIKIIFKNKKNEELIVSNINSTLCSLPWTLTYKGKTFNSYNPKLTTLLKSILPSDFNNYKMLLGGQLIYELVEARIIDKLKYKNDY